MGAVLALTTAADLPDRVRRVVRGEHLRLPRRDRPVRPPRQGGGRRGGAQARAPSLIAARSRYPEIKAPIHLVYGEKDWSRPSDRAANKDLLPDAEFAQVPGAGHFITLERPDVLAGLVNAAA